MKKLKNLKARLLSLSLAFVMVLSLAVGMAPMEVHAEGASMTQSVGYAASEIEIGDRLYEGDTITYLNGTVMVWYCRYGYSASSDNLEIVGDDIVCVIEGNPTTLDEPLADDVAAAGWEVFDIFEEDGCCNIMLRANDEKGVYELLPESEVSVEKNEEGIYELSIQEEEGYTYYYMYMPLGVDLGDGYIMTYEVALGEAEALLEGEIWRLNPLYKVPDAAPGPDDPVYEGPVECGENGALVYVLKAFYDGNRWIQAGATALVAGEATPVTRLNLVADPSDPSQGVADCGGQDAGYTWVKETKTLTLHGITLNCDSEYEPIIELPTDSTIVLAEGTVNTINSSFYGYVINAYGDLTITGAGSLIFNCNSALGPYCGGELIINGGNITTNCYGGIIAVEGLSVTGGLLDITVNGTEDTDGIWTEGNVNISDNATVKIKVPAGNRAIFAKGTLTASSIKNGNLSSEEDGTFVNVFANDASAPVVINEKESGGTQTPDNGNNGGSNGGSSSGADNSSTPSTPAPTPAPAPVPTPTPAPVLTPAPITVPVSNGESDNVVHINASVSGETAKVSELTADEINKVANNESNTKSIEIDLSETGKKVKEVALPAYSLNEIAITMDDPNNKLDNITIKLSTATVEISEQALKAVLCKTTGNDLKLVVDDIQKDTLNDTQKEAVKNQNVHQCIDAYFISNGVRIGDFQGGTATLRLPFDVPAGLNGNAFSVWYVGDDGTIEKHDTKYENGELVFTVSHFSDYVVVYDAAVKDDVPKTGEATDYTTILWTTMLAIGVVGLALNRQKRRQ